jgi:iron complex transport system ATP-binding protein
VITPDLLAEVFGLQAVVLPDPVSDGVLVVPVGSSRTSREQGEA